MSDPVQSNAHRVVAQLAKTAGLQELLREGPARGRVARADAGGRAVIQLAGGRSVEIATGNLQRGQQVLLRLAGGRVTVELTQSPRGGAAPSQPSAPAAAPQTSMAQTLSQLGVSGQAAEAVVRALIRADIPLDKAAVRALVDLLPGAQTGQTAALAFLFGRGLPIGGAIADLIARLFSRTPLLSEPLQKTARHLKQLADRVEEEDSEDTPPGAAKKLRRYHDSLHEKVMPLRSPPDEEFEEQLGQRARENLQTAESAMTSEEGADGGEAEPVHLGAELLELHAYLMSLEASLRGSPLHPLLIQLLGDVRESHETMTTLALRNLPGGGEGAGPYYLQIPFRERKRYKHLEIRYRPREDGEPDAGTLDLRIDLSRLGPLLITIQWTKPRAAVTIAADRDDAREHLRGALDELRAAMKNLKGLIVEVRDVVSGPVPESIRPDDWDEPAPLEGVDLKA